MTRCSSSNGITRSHSAAAIAFAAMYAGISGASIG
jgi:hypothetical protein